MAFSPPASGTPYEVPPKENHMIACDNLSVGVLITDRAGRHLMFDRARPPVGVAPVAGHIDDHGGAEDAARAEVAEEVGLTVTGLTPLRSAWRDNRCRRAPGPRGIGHRWTIYRAEVTGDLAPSAEETRNARWLTPAEVQTLADRTAAYAHGEVGDTSWAAAPGIEPVWVEWLAAAGIVAVTPATLSLIDRLAGRPV